MENYKSILKSAKKKIREFKRYQMTKQEILLISYKLKSKSLSNNLRILNSKDFGKSHEHKISTNNIFRRWHNQIILNSLKEGITIPKNESTLMGFKNDLFYGCNKQNQRV